MEAKFYHWGPLLFHVKITEEDLKKLKKIILKEQSHHKKLAGIIDGQYTFKDAEKIKFGKILNSYLQEFIFTRLWMSSIKILRKWGFSNCICL